ncbi:MAG: LysM peptidoglycan-binding domain-containing protein [Pirellulales bacterium]
MNPPGEVPSPETGAELPDQGHDRYAIDAEPARPAEAPHAAQPPTAAEGAPGVDRSGPEVPGGPQGIDRAPAPVQADDAPQPAQDDVRQDPDNHRGQPSQNDWSTSGAADDPVAGRNAPLPVEDGMYTVQPNDTLWSISEKVYGTGGYFKAIAAHNRANLPRSDQLSVGMKIAVPAVGELEQDYPSLCPKQRKSALVKPRAMPATANVPDGSASDVYVVEEGDTLFDIARYELGKASRWAEIYELNREKLGQDFDYLQPGTELRLPAKTRAAESVSRDRDTRYLR